MRGDGLGVTGRMSIYSIVLILVAAILLVAAGIVKFTMRRKHPAKACAQCGEPSSHGYAKQAETERDDLVPLCVNCLIRRLDDDYRRYQGQAVVIQPVAELPCYVFRPKTAWGEAVRADLDFILSGLQTHCHTCGQKARYAWVNALEPGPVTRLPELGIKQALLIGAKGPPVSLCPRCTVTRLAHSLTAQEGGYLEICGPRGGEDGLVSGMGY